jgi:hypothetical protein
MTRHRKAFLHCDGHAMPAGDEDFAAFCTRGEVSWRAESDFAAAKSSEVGNIVAATASGTEARKSRRFICGMVKEWRGKLQLGEPGY